MSVNYRQSTKPSIPSKTVRFSPMRELLIYVDRGNKTDLFFTQQDYQEMRISNRQYIMEAQQKLLSLMSGDSDPQVQPEDFDFTGIENFASPGMMTKLISSRQKCLRAVLEEQARQDHLGEYNPYKLARASQHHTKWVADRAHKIGEHLHKSVKK